MIADLSWRPSETCHRYLEQFEDILYISQYEQPAMQSVILTLQRFTPEGNLLTRFLESLTLTTRPLQSEPL